MDHVLLLNAQTLMAEAAYKHQQASREPGEDNIDSCLQLLVNQQNLWAARLAMDTHDAAGIAAGLLDNMADSLKDKIDELRANHKYPAMWKRTRLREIYEAVERIEEATKALNKHVEDGKQVE